jgi:hypothetical protein
LLLIPEGLPEKMRLASFPVNTPNKGRTYYGE